MSWAKWWIASSPIASAANFEIVSYRLKNLSEIIPYLPRLPANIADLKGTEWGRCVRCGDIVLEAPKLMAIRRESGSKWQCLYKTIENPALGPLGERGFILTPDGEVGFKHTIGAIYKWSVYWPWIPV